MALHNEKERKWRRFSDRRITEVSEADLKKEAYATAVALIYRGQSVSCTPFHQRPVHEPAKQAVVLSDYNLTKRIDQMRVERFLKSYSEMAHD